MRFSKRYVANSMLLSCSLKVNGRERGVRRRKKSKKTEGDERET